MSTTSLPLHVMPSDAARIGASQQAGERLVEFGATLGRGLWRALEAIGESRGRAALAELAANSAAGRPELAAALRQAARKSWME